MSATWRLTDEEVRAIADRLNHASTRPWKVDADFDGDNWLIASLGNSSIDGKDYHITTDQVRASEFEGDAKTDAEFIVWARNDMRRIGKAYLAAIECLDDLRVACEAAAEMIELDLTEGADRHALWAQLAAAIARARGES